MLDGHPNPPGVSRGLYRRHFDGDHGHWILSEAKKKWGYIWTGADVGLGGQRTPNKRYKIPPFRSIILLLLSSLHVHSFIHSSVDQNPTHRKHIQKPNSKFEMATTNITSQDQFLTFVGVHVPFLLPRNDHVLAFHPQRSSSQARTSSSSTGRVETKSPRSSMVPNALVGTRGSSTSPRTSVFLNICFTSHRKESS